MNFKVIINLRNQYTKDAFHLTTLIANEPTKLYYMKYYSSSKRKKEDFFTVTFLKTNARIITINWFRHKDSVDGRIV